MVEVVHEHEAHSGSGANGIALIIGIILAIAIFLFLLYTFGRGFIPGAAQQPQINVPERMDVNVNQ